MNSYNVPRSLVRESIYTYIKEFPRLHRFWAYLTEHSEFADQIGIEIDAAISLFNRYRKDPAEVSPTIPLRSASDLREIIHENLPSTSELIDRVMRHENREKLLDKVIIRINQFNFIDSLTPIEYCTAALLLGSYRSAMLELLPYLESNNAQIASALEEMIAIMALNDEKTLLFEACRQWYADYENEGFSEELSLAVQDVK